MATDENANMRVKIHTRYTGYLVLNLQALETTIRAFLECRDGGTLEFPKPGDASTDETWLTRYCYFGPLVDEFNSSLRSEEERQLYTLNTDIVNIRNAFAHGRLFTDFERFPARLWMFGRKKNGEGKLDVEFSQLLTPEWLLKNHNFVVSESAKVRRCFKKRAYKGLR